MPGNDTSTRANNRAVDPTMPGADIPKSWQCTDVPALKELPKNRSCLAYDTTKGYTHYMGKCIQSDYNGCIDTYNKFKDLESCTQSKLCNISSIYIISITLCFNYHFFRDINFLK